MVSITEASPITSTPTNTASPSCVPATLARPARVPCVSELATISVTVGPGTSVKTTQAAKISSDMVSYPSLREGGEMRSIEPGGIV